VIARKDVMRALHKQGLGRHTDEEINTISQRTFQSLSDVLGEKTYFFGETPCTFDATAFGFLSQFIDISLNNEMNDLARGYDNLVDYCQNFRTKFY
jgi:glutathione S-transferase